MAGTGFTSIADYLAANAGTVDAMRAGLVGDANAQIGAAKSADDAVIGKVTPGSDYSSIPGYMDALVGEQDAAANAANLKTEGGLDTSLRQKYGAKDPGYTHEKAAFDASLLLGNNDLNDPAARGQTLLGYLNAGASKAATPLPTPPPVPVNNGGDAGGPPDEEPKLPYGGDPGLPYGSRGKGPSWGKPNTGWKGGGH